MTDLSSSNAFVPNYERDKLITKFGLETLHDRYLLSEEKSPQDAFLRASLAFSDDLDHAERMYDYVSKHWMMFATPILSNGGTTRGLAVSCYLNKVPDSREGLTAHYTENAFLSSLGGGIGGTWGSIRSNGEKVGKQSQSTGCIPFLKVVDSEMMAFQQGVSRRGSYAAYLPVDHPEIEEFIVMRKPTGGDVNRKCLNLHHGVCIPDSFMNAVQGDWDWQLVDPHSKKIAKTVKARHLWQLILETRMSTGEPYLFFSDTVERMKDPAHKDLKIEASNLCCITGDQLVSSQFGLKTVLDLYKDGKNLIVPGRDGHYNASPMTLIKKDAEVVEIITKEGYSHKVTPDHKVWVKDFGWREAKDLVKGDKLQIQQIEGQWGKVHRPKEAFICGLVAGDGTFGGNAVCVDIWEYNFHHLPMLEKMIHEIIEENLVTVSVREHERPTFNKANTAQSNCEKVRLSSSALSRCLANLGFTRETKCKVPAFVLEGDKETVSNYLAGLYLADCTYQTSNGASTISLASIHVDLLKDLQVILANFSIRSNINKMHSKRQTLLPDGKGGKALYNCQESFRLLINNKTDSKKFLDATGLLALKPSEKMSERMNKNREMVDGKQFYNLKHAKSVTFDRLEVRPNEDVYCVEVFSDDHAWSVNGLVTKNSEIIEPTSDERTAICCLSSVNLEKFDEWKDDPIFIGDIVRFLDNVISDFIKRAPAALSKATFSASQERSIGLGAMGFHAYLQKNNIPFESALASGINRKVFSLIKSKAKEASEKLAEERGACPDLEKIGTKRRNVYLMAIAPNATSSIICGETSPSIEPYRANAYVHKTMSGSFLVKNKFLKNLLIEKDMDRDEIWQSIITNEGSVQHLDFLTEWEKDIFKTSIEIDQHWIVQHAADRAPMICQSQSVNLFLPPDVNIKYLHSLHFQAWKKGLKTLYYLRSTSLKRAEIISARIAKLERKEYDDCISCQG